MRCCEIIPIRLDRGSGKYLEAGSCWPYVEAAGAQLCSFANRARAVNVRYQVVAALQGWCIPPCLCKAAAAAAQSVAVERARLAFVD